MVREWTLGDAVRGSEVDVEHKKGCIELQKMEDRKLYEQAWPHHCRNCEGWGGHYGSFDPSPAGVSLSSGSLVEVDPCPECVEKSVCPRCGVKDEAHVLTGDEFENCTQCDWRWDEDHGMPELDICACEYEDAFDELPF